MLFSEIKDLTAVGRFLGFEIVALTHVDQRLPLLFPNRKTRLAFFEALKLCKPDIRIYRAF